MKGPTAMNTRKILLGGLIGTAGIGAVLALAGPANAATTNADGSINVTKAEIQASSAFKWNNSDFDSHVVKGGAGGKDITFSVGWVETYDNVLTCGANADNKVVHVPVTSHGESTYTAVQTLSSNGKQVSGWTLTGGVNATGSND